MRGDRKLSRIPALSAAARTALAAAGLESCADVLGLSELELVQRLDLYLSEVRAILDAVAAAIAPRCCTADEMLSAARFSDGGGRPLRTGHPPLDAHLGGGLPSHAISELVGPAGVGKTQLCLAVAARAILDGASRRARVLYVDTERSFAPRRLVELLQTIGSGPGGIGGGAGIPSGIVSVEAAEQLASRLTVLRPTDWEQYERCLSSQLELELLRPPHVSLLVVDSVAAPVRSHFDRGVRGELAARQLKLAEHAARLKYYADTYSIGVLCVNQVAGFASDRAAAAAAGGVGDVVKGDDTLSAGLGVMWAHCVNTRLVLQYDEAAACLPPPAPLSARASGGEPPPLPPPLFGGGRAAQLRVAKAPNCREALFDYRVDAFGLRPHAIDPYI